MTPVLRRAAPYELKVQIEPDLPSMGHGSPGNEQPQLVSENLYRGLVNFTMAGPWLVHVSFTEHGRELGRTAFSFEVLR